MCAKLDLGRVGPSYTQVPFLEDTGIDTGMTLGSRYGIGTEYPSYSQLVSSPSLPDSVCVIYLRWTPPPINSDYRGIIGIILGSSCIPIIPLVQGAGSS